MIDTGERVAVLDLGKTNIKVLVATPNGEPVEILSYPNAPDMTGPYLAIDLNRIEPLILDALTELGKRHRIRAIVAPAHGCGGVLVDDHNPVLPAMDYEAKAPDWLAEAYAEVGPTYAEVFCSLSGGAMRPVAVEPARGGWTLTHRCETCGTERRCKSAASDDRDALLAVARAAAQARVR